MNRPSLTIIVSFVFLLLIACTNSEESVPTLTDADNGGRIEIGPEDALEIVLESNPSTGYTWTMAGLDLTVLTPSDEEEFRRAGDAPGAGGHQIIRLHAREQGQTQVTLIYHRPFEQGIPPLKTFQATVVVR